jgi:bidirectional [NiFe] hydrogenase diaphorase subunit
MTVKFTINGVTVEAKEGESVIDVSRRYGFEIPSLCHHQAVTPYGACRVCLVEITKGGRKKLTTSCNYEVLDGIEVVTDSAQIARHRAMVLELILAEAPDAEPVRELAWEYGVNVSRFRREETAQTEKRRDCILCGLCARVCAEVIKVDAISFNGRGDKRDIGSPYNEATSACVGCASCAAICPTACITVTDENNKRTIWGRTFEMVACEACGEPVMTEEYRDYAIANRDLAPDYYTTCSACKKKKLASHFDKVGS